MENKESGAARPVGICEKLFNALHLNPTFRPLRRIAYHPQETATVAAAKPASLPPAPSAVGDGPAPPTSKSSGSEYSSVAAAAAARQVSAKKVPEPKLSKVESQSVTIPLKAPSKVDLPAAAAAAGATTIPSQKFSYVEPAAAVAAAAGATAIPSKKLSYAEPQPPPQSRLPAERVPSSSGKPAAPTPPPEKVVSTTDGTRTSVDSTKPAPATEEAGRTRTRRNLNDRVDEYINRTKNKLRTASGGPSSTSK